jgi:Predicted membrane-bound metal-dependent hydrolases
LNVRTHIAGGIYAGCALFFISMNGNFNLEPLTAVETSCTVALSCFGALSPDIDIHTSKLGSSVKPLSALINALFGHRTICHSPIVWLIVSGSLYSLYPAAFIYILAFIAGVLSHLFLDMLNKAGIPIFWPLKKRFRLAGIKTGSFLESCIFYLLCGLIVFSVAKPFTELL